MHFHLWQIWRYFKFNHVVAFLLKQSDQSAAPNILTEFHDRQMYTVHFAHIVLSKVTCFLTIKLLINSQQSGANSLQNSHQRQLIEHGNEVIYAWGKRSVEILEDAVPQLCLDASLSFQKIYH